MVATVKSCLDKLGRDGKMQPLVVKALTNPKSYDVPVERVKLVQTHISYVFLTGKYAYKVKKAVKFDFLDFSSLKKRKLFCEKELELNRRFSKGVYLEVVPITESKGEIRIKGEGKPIEYAVKMKELPKERMLSELLKRGKVNRQMIEGIAKAIAKFHLREKASKEISRYGEVRLVGSVLSENFSTVKPFIGKTIEKEQFDYVWQKVWKFLKYNCNLFEKRVSEGRIKDCHGDLRSENIFVLDEINLTDCIEFNKRFRYIDVASDVAFLAVELDFYGRKDLSEFFIQKYLDYTKDKGLLKLLNFYKCYRAWVVGKVYSLKSVDPQVNKRERKKSKEIAKRYFQLSFEYAKRILPKPVLILMCGLTGTGKSFLADALAKEIDVKIFRSDIIRKELAGLPPTASRREGFKEGIYSEEFTEKTYKELLRRGRRAIEGGNSCILDATFSKSRDRERAYEVAKKLRVACLTIYCTCPVEIVRKRLLKRVGGVTVSDGRWEIYPAQKRIFEKPRPPERFIQIDTSTSLTNGIKKVLNEIDRLPA